MSIPLVQNNDKDAINTSIIAIKRNIERINMLLGLVDSGSPDLSGLATKQELEDAITQVETDLAPVDEVTLGNMQSVTSNAVAECFNVKTLWTGDVHTVGNVITLNENISKYKMLFFYVNVIPSRTPEFDILASVFLPEVHTVCEFDLNMSMNSNYGGNASFAKSHDNQFTCNRWTYYPLNSSYTSGLCRVVGVLK